MTQRHTTLALLLAALGTAAAAAPYATTYSSLVGPAPTLAGLNTGDPYTITIIMDNGGTQAGSQTWESASCVIWRIGPGGNRVYTQAGHATTGAATTLADGTLSNFFSYVTGTGDTGNHTATGFSPALTPVILWNANGLAPVFQDSSSQAFSDGIDASGGVTMTPGAWSAPQRVTGPCDDTLYTAPGPTPTPVPTLGHAALALTSGALGLLGWRARRRRNGAC